MSTTATKICARVTNNPASSGRNTLGLEFITTGFGSAEETPKLSGWQGFAHPYAYAGWNRMDSRSWTLVSIFRANLDDEVARLFGEENSPRICAVIPSRADGEGSHKRFTASAK